MPEIQAPKFKKHDISNAETYRYYVPTKYLTWQAVLVIIGCSLFGCLCGSIIGFNLIISIWTRT
jgi:hypothetical protein